MNVIATTGSEEVHPTQATDVCNVVLLYQDSLAQDRALEVGHRLGAQYKNGAVFAFEAWNLKDLAEVASAQLAREAAARADILLFSTYGDDLSPAVRAWLESWLETRTKAEGILALLVSEPVSASAVLAALVPRLHEAALRSRMTFLSYLPGQTEARAGEGETRTNDLAAFPGETAEEPHWLHWGLNE